MGIRKRIKDFIDWCPQPSTPLSTKLKRYSMPIAAIVTATIIFSVSFSVFFSNLVSHPYVPIMPLIIQENMENFVTDITAADGKVFTIDNYGNVNCFNAQTNATVWSTNAGSYTSMPQSVMVYNGLVYVATAGGTGGIVKSLYIDTGKVLREFQAPVSSSFGYKSPPSYFAVGDGFVFVSSDGLNAYNASTGKLLWEVQSPSSARPPFTIPQTRIVWPLGNSVFFAQGDAGDAPLYRINPQNGDALWYTTGYFSSPPLYSGEQIILWNYDSTSDEGKTIVSLNASSGTTLWTFDVGSSVFQPSIFEDLLFFGASNGNFYAVHLSDGKPAWQTHIDEKSYMNGNNLPPANANSEPIVTPVEVDAEQQTVFWGFAIAQSGVDGKEGNEQYVGTLCSLDVTDGRIMWNRQIVSNSSIWNPLSSSTDGLGLTVAKNIVYLTATNSPSYALPGGDLWRIDETTGAVIDTQHFDHYVLPPVQTEDVVFVAADLYLLAYQNGSETPPSSNGTTDTVNDALPIVIGVIAAVIAVAAVAVLILKRK